MTYLKIRMTKNVRGILREMLFQIWWYIRCIFSKLWLFLLWKVVKTGPVVMQRSIYIMCGNNFEWARAEVTGWRKLYVSKWWCNQLELEIMQSVLCARQLKRVESHRNWLVLVSLLIVLLYWWQRLSLPLSHRFMIEPYGARLPSEFVSVPTNVSVNLENQDVDVPEAAHFFSRRIHIS